jgi:hypothetical protein
MAWCKSLLDKRMRKDHRLTKVIWIGNQRATFLHSNWSRVVFLIKRKWRLGKTFTTQGHTAMQGRAKGLKAKVPSMLTMPIWQEKKKWGYPTTTRLSKLKEVLRNLTPMEIKGLLTFTGISLKTRSTCIPLSKMQEESQPTLMVNEIISQHRLKFSHPLWVNPKCGRSRSKFVHSLAKECIKKSRVTKVSSRVWPRN